MGKTVIKINNLVKIFGEFVALYDVGLEIKAGEIFGIIGSSGAGKTTLLNSIVGFIKPEKGNILIRSEYLHTKENKLFTDVHETPEEVKMAIGVAAQHPSIYDSLTVKENLEYFGSLYGLSKSSIEQNSKVLLKLVNLTGNENKKAGNLSGGMRRRLDIACSMMHNPNILILDEPTSDLDPYLRSQIWALVKKINKAGTTIIVSSHNLAELEELCDRICLINKGRIVSTGTPLEIKKKFLTHEEIRIESYPGKYEHILGKLKNVKDARVEGSELVIRTEKPGKLIYPLMELFKRNREEIIDIKITKSSLDKVFVEVASSGKFIQKKELKGQK